ncbi:MAG: META domain-containing protein [Saprospiraceae bacterium]
MYYSNADSEKLSSQWKLHCKNIDGFEHKVGIQSKLLVKDFGNSLYRVKSVLEEKSVMDPKFDMDWVLESIPDFSKELSTSRPPTLVFKENFSNVTGFDGCNNFHGGILEFTEDRLVFGDFLRTKMACLQNQNIDNEYNWRLSNTYSYHVEKGHLILKDNQGRSILKFKKGEPDLRDRN